MSPTGFPFLPILLIAAVLGLGAIPARAEENRLLPFWGQPFPSGFARRPVITPACRRRHHGARHADPCAAVLHARD